MNDSNVSGRLSKAGREALTEHLDAERVRILAEATRLSDGAPLSAFDIVNAVDVLSTRDRGASTHRYSQVRSARSRTTSLAILVTTLLVTLVATLAVWLAFTFQQPQTPAPWSEVLLSVIAGALTAAAGAAALVGLRLMQRTNRYSREIQNRQLEHVDEGAGQRRKPWDLSQPSDRATGSFISNWVRLEFDLRELGSDNLGIPYEDARRYPIGELLRMLVKAGTLSESNYVRTRELLTLRNKVVHGQDFAADDLEKAEKQILNLRSALSTLPRRAGKR